jgi:hypothetical protein
MHFSHPPPVLSDWCIFRWKCGAVEAHEGVTKVAGQVAEGVRPGAGGCSLNHEYRYYIMYRERENYVPPLRRLTSPQQTTYLYQP